MFGPGLPCASRDPPRPDGQAFGAARAAAGARVRCALQGSHWLDLVAEHSRPGTRITTQQPAVARRVARVDTTFAPDSIPRSFLDLHRHLEWVGMRVSDGCRNGLSGGLWLSSQPGEACEPAIGALCAEASGRVWMRVLTRFEFPVFFFFLAGLGVGEKSVGSLLGIKFG